MQRAAIQVNVAPVGPAENRMDLGSVAAEQFRGQPGCRAIAAIDDDADTVEPDRNSRKQIVDVALVEPRIHLERFRSGLYATLVNEPENFLLDPVLLIIRQLKPGVAEDL